MVSFLPPIGNAQVEGANAGWLLRFLSIEVCKLTGSECGRVARFDANGSGSGRVRLETGTTGSYFLTVWHTRETRLVPGERYRLQVLVGPMEVGSRDLVVSSAGRGRSADDPLPVNPGASLPVKFRVDEQSFTSGLAGLTVTPGVSPAGGVVGVAAPPLAMSGALQLFVGGEPASVRTRSEGGLVAGVPLFLAASKWPAPPAGPVDVLLFRDGVAVALGRGALTVKPWQSAPGSAERARHALGEIVTSFDRIGAAVATMPGEQQQWLSGLSRALDALVNGSDPRAFAGALAAADAAERRLLDAWFVESGVLAALEQYAGMVADAASALKEGRTTAALSSLRTLALAAPQAGPALTRMAPASTSFPTDLELSEAMQFYETVKEFGQTFVHDTNSTFGEHVGIAAGLIGLVRAVPAVAVISAVLAVADFAINKLFIALLPADIDRFELSLAEVLLERGEITDAVLRLEAINKRPPIGIQEVIGTLLSVLGVRDAPEIQSLTDALLQTANFMLTTIQNAIGSYAEDHPELELNPSVGSVPAMRWSTTVTDPTLVDRNSDTDAVVRGLPDAVNWQVQTGPEAVGEGRLYATTTANAFGDDFRSSNTVVVNVEGLDVDIAPNSVTLGPGDTQQFTATVTNATNTDVTWAATGGAVDPDGTYIAGNTPGTYTVTATSVDDPTVSGSATIEIRQPAGGVARLYSSASSAVTCSGRADEARTGAPPDATSWDGTVICSGPEGNGSQGSSGFSEHHAGGRLHAIEASGLAEVAGGTAPGGWAFALAIYEVAFDVDQPTRITVAGSLSGCAGSIRPTLVLASFRLGVVVQRTCGDPGFTTTLDPGAYRITIRAEASALGAGLTAAPAFSATVTFSAP